MTSALTHDQIQMLLGAYALDAVEGEEAETVEFHLLECTSCHGEVSANREIAGAMAGSYSPAPVPMWNRIAANLEEPPSTKLIRLHPRRRYIRMAVAAASVAAIAIGALGIRVAEQDRRITNTQTALQHRTVLSAALAAQSDPAARRTNLRSGDGMVLAHAVLTPDGTGYLWSDGLPRLAPELTYQLWAVIGNEPISAAVLGPGLEVVPFRASGHVVGLAITEEKQGGVVASQHQRVVSGLVQEA